MDLQLDSLTTITKQNLRGVWSLKVLFKDYINLPVVRLSNGSGTLVQDFYADHTGTSLTTLPRGSGIDVSSWMTTNSIPYAFVRIWYDQSSIFTGVSYNATATSSQRPVLKMTTKPYSITGKHIVNSDLKYFNLPTGTIVGNSTCTFSGKFTYTDNISIDTTGIIGGGSTSINTGNSLLLTNNKIKSYWVSNDFIFDVNYQIVYTPVVVSLTINNKGNDPTENESKVYSDNNINTYWNSKGYVYSNLISSNIRNNWNFIPGNDRLMNVITIPTLQADMYWFVNSSCAMCDKDRRLIENIDNEENYFIQRFNFMNRFIRINNRPYKNVIYQTNILEAPFPNETQFYMIDYNSGKYLRFDGVYFKLANQKINAIRFKILNDSSVYNNNNGGVAIQTFSGTNADGEYLRHSSSLLYCLSESYIASNPEFSFKFIPVKEVKKNTYIITSWYNQNSTCLGISSTPVGDILCLDTFFYPDYKWIIEF